MVKGANFKAFDLRQRLCCCSCWCSSWPTGAVVAGANAYDAAAVRVASCQTRAPSGSQSILPRGSVDYLARRRRRRRRWCTRPAPCNRCTVGRPSSTSSSFSGTVYSFLYKKRIVKRCPRFIFTLAPLLITTLNPASRLDYSFRFEKLNVA